MSVHNDRPVVMTFVCDEVGCDARYMTIAALSDGLRQARVLGWVVKYPSLECRCPNHNDHLLLPLRD